MDNSGSGPPRPAYDPGWNDPPKFTFNPNDAAPKVKLNLNKRVAFPMASSPSGGSANRTTELAPSGLPMPHSKNAPPPMIPGNSHSPAGTLSAPPPPPPATTTSAPADTPTLIEAVKALSVDDLKSEAIVAVENLIKVAEEKIDQQTIPDILSRLGTCRRDIEANSYPVEVLQLLTQLDKALLDGDYKLSSQHHQLLMVNHIQFSSHWGPAVKKIIATTTTTTTEPELAPELTTTNERAFVSEHEAPNLPPVPFYQPVSADDQPKVVRQEVPVSPQDNNRSNNSPSLLQKLKSRILHV